MNGASRLVGGTNVPVTPTRSAFAKALKEKYG